MQGVVFYLVYQ